MSEFKKFNQTKRENSLTRALHYKSSSLIMPFQYLGSIYALSVGYLMLDERMNSVVLIGILVILLGVVLNTIFKSNKKNQL
jgi:drug/metabolite transporter (DMT)-like permease